MIPTKWQTQPFDRENTQKILVCICKHYGDVLLSSPVFYTLKKYLPHAHITAFIYPETKPMLEGNPYIDDFIFTPARQKKNFFRKIFQEIQTLKTIRKKQFDLAINLTSGDRGSLAVRFSRAKTRVGFMREDHRGFAYKEKFFTHSIRNIEDKRHAVDKYLDVVRAIGIVPSMHDKKVFFHIPQKAKDSIQTQIPPKPFFVLAPTSTLAFKQWPARHFARVVDQVDMPCVMITAPNSREIALANKIQSLTKKEILNLSGKLQIKELGALIEKSELLVCVDSMPAHLASCMQKTLVVLFGPSDDVVWGPWQNPHASVVRSNSKEHMICKACKQEGCGNTWRSDCLENLNPDWVIQQIQEKIFPKKSLNILD